MGDDINRAHPLIDPMNILDIAGSKDDRGHTCAVKPASIRYRAAHVHSWRVADDVFNRSRQLTHRTRCWIEVRSREFYWILWWAPFNPWPMIS